MGASLLGVSLTDSERSYITIQMGDLAYPSSEKQLEPASWNTNEMNESPLLNKQAPVCREGGLGLLSKNLLTPLTTINPCK